MIAAAPVRAPAPARPAASFAIPPGSEAEAPPERRGVARDGVRLLVARADGVAHARFHDLPDHLAPGDLLVVNTSATLPAALEAARADGRAAPVHVATSLDDGDWVVEVRRGDGAGPATDAARGERLRLPDGRRLRLVEPYPDPSLAAGRLWRARARPGVELAWYLSRHGRPIGYGHLAGRFPLADYQTVYAAAPGQRRDGQRRAPLHGAPARALDGARGDRGAGGPARRGVEPRARRAAPSGAVRGAGRHGAPGAQRRRPPAAASWPWAPPSPARSRARWARTTSCARPRAGPAWCSAPTGRRAR